MKQKIVIRIGMCDDNTRSKALKVVVSIPGVESAAVAGEEKDQVVVVGDGIDSVQLTRRLRKKVRHAELLSVGAVNSEQPSPPAAPEDPPVSPPPVAPPYYAFPLYRYYEVREPDYYSPCAIL